MVTAVLAVHIPHSLPNAIFPTEPFLFSPFLKNISFNTKNKSVMSLELWMLYKCWGKKKQEHDYQ